MHEPLTSREQQVAALLADGLAYREIAARLGCRPATVESHVRHLRAKLGRGRVGIAVWVTERRMRGEVG